METSLPLVAFVVAATVTPGPNNLMVLASGANWGLARTLPHILGIALGFPVMILAVGLGLSAVFAGGAVAPFGAANTSPSPISAGSPGGSPRPRGRARPAASARPLNLWQAAAFQWVNPKAWTLILSGMAVFVDPAGNRLCQSLALRRFSRLSCCRTASPGRCSAAAIARFLSTTAAGAGSTSPWPCCLSARRCRPSLERARQPAYAAGGLANTMAGRNSTPEAGKCDSSPDRD